MTKTNQKKIKRMENKKKKQRRKLIITVLICVLVAGGIAAYFVLRHDHDHDHSADNRSIMTGEVRTFSDGHQSVTLQNDGSFTARLAHGRKSGTYTENTQGAVTWVIFSYDGTSARGRLEGDILTIPDEWDDHHGHGSVLRRR